MAPVLSESYPAPFRCDLQNQLDEMFALRNMTLLDHGKKIGQQWGDRPAASAGSRGGAAGVKTPTATGKEERLKQIEDLQRQVDSINEAIAKLRSDEAG